MTLSRRSFISAIGKTAGLFAVVTSLPQVAWAKWNKEAFTASNLDAAIKARYGDRAIIDSADVGLGAPPIAENGAVVPITLKMKLTDVKNVSLFVKDNPAPLTTTLNIGPSTIPNLKIRIRMGKTSDVVAIVEAGDKLYRATQQVKVTKGGCGG